MSLAVVVVVGRTLFPDGSEKEVVVVELRIHLGCSRRVVEQREVVVQGSGVAFVLLLRHRFVGGGGGGGGGAQKGDPLLMLFDHLELCFLVTV